MALIIETGLKEGGANSYADVAFADAYHAMYGNDAWAGDTSVKEQALILACQSLELMYGPKYLSHRLEGVQSLLWPRYPFYDRNGNTRLSPAIPVELKNAQCELALMALAGDDLFPQEFKESSLISETIKIGDVHVENTYSKPTSYTTFRKVELLLYSVTRQKNATVQLVR